MNIANKLTLARVILIPFFLLFLLVDAIPYNYIIATLIFIVASITDAIDGSLARKRHLITDFGKFLDPLADKALVISALICFVELGWAWSVLIVIIIAREFLVTSLRLVASTSDGTVIAASIWGKLKTVSQMVGIITILVIQSAIQINVKVSDILPVATINSALMWIAMVFTVISGIQYMWQYRHAIDIKK